MGFKLGSSRRGSSQRLNFAANIAVALSLPATTTLEYLVVAGGAAGGKADPAGRSGAGGGAGGFRTNLLGHPLAATPSSYTVTQVYLIQ